MLQTEWGFENNSQQRGTKYNTGGKKRLYFKIDTVLKKGGAWVMKKMGSVFQNIKTQ